MHPCDLKFLTVREKDFGSTGRCILSYAKGRLNSERRKPLAVQWLGVHTLTAKHLGSIPSWETKIPQAKKPEDKTEQNKVVKEKNKYSIVCGRK